MTREDYACTSESGGFHKVVAAFVDKRAERFVQVKGFTDLLGNAEASYVQVETMYGYVDLGEMVRVYEDLRRETEGDGPEGVEA